MNRLHQDESGVITAYFVVIALILIGLTALAFDVGLLHLQRRVAQNAVDPAVLAGAAYLERCPLAGEGNDPLDVAEDFAGRNLGVGAGFAGDDDLIQTALSTFHVENDVGEANWPSVRSRVTRDQNYFFGRVLGLVSAKVPAEAEAVCGAISEGTICPMYIVGDPNQPPTYGTDPDGSGPLTAPLVSAYGLTIGKVYSMKDSQGHIGALQAPIGPGVAHWTDFIRQGCVDEDGSLVAYEGGDVGTRPGGWGMPTVTALEGGNGSNSAGLYEEELTYETLGYPGPDLFPNGHLDCDLHLTVAADPAIVLEVRAYDSNRNPLPTPLTAQETVLQINLMSDPQLMPSGAAPCGGLRSDGTVVSELVTANVQGRFMLIAMTNGACLNPGHCDLPVLGILRMFIVCWTNQEAQSGNIPVNKRCVPNSNPPGQNIYGVFADFKAPNLLGGGGLGTNPLAPFHVVLVQ